MKPSHIKAALATLLAIRQPVFLWGPPGVGKSQLVAQTAKAHNLALIDIRAILLDPVDLRGIPRITETHTASWCPPAFLPKEEQTRGILFLDELNAAPPLVQAACYQLVLDRRIGEYLLPDGWCVVAAGNREGDRSVTHHMPTALANRMVHLECEVDINDWLLWAKGAGIRPEVTAFLQFRPKLLHDFDPARRARAFASPRSWEFLSRILDANPSPDIIAELATGTIGPGASAEFLGFLTLWRELPDVPHILAHPDTASVPEEPAALYALAEALAQATSPATMDALVCYAQRLPVEFGVLLLRDACQKDPSLVSNPAFIAWAQANADVFL
ncbi:MAG: AAA family ATPase [Desulfovibrio sp.]|nr:AAA family ATPase [Desulfovibrio sp.]